MAAVVRIPPVAQLAADPPPEILRCDLWECSPGHDHWDYRVDLDWERTLRLEPAAFRTRMGLSAQATVALVASWVTDLTTYQRRHGPVVPISLDGADWRELTVRVNVSGFEAGGRLSLITQLIFLQDPTPRSGGPRIPGSVLWEHRRDFPLEGTGSRLPVAEVDFGQFPGRFPESALWSVKLTPDAMDRPPSVGMNIYLNTRHRELVALLTKTDSESESAASWVQRLMYMDVGRQLLNRAFASDQFLDPDHQYADGTLGDALRRRVGALFPTLTINEVAALLLDDPDEFEIAVQTLAGRP